jgi:hypothetical protein
MAWDAPALEAAQGQRANRHQRNPQETRMSDMSIEQARKSKEAAEDQIAGILMELHKATGLYIKGVNATPSQIHYAGCRRPIVTSFEVRIEMEGP